MSLHDLVKKTRSYRRFAQDPLSAETLRGLVDLARLSASGGNKQPLKYLLSADAETNAKIFPCTVWAAALKDWDGPAEGERPTGYIVILVDKEISNGAGCDHGIAAQSMALGAMEQGIGACMVGSIKREELRAALGLPERYDVALILALGKPGEEVVLEEAPDGEVTYYRDAQGRHHVPKRPLDEVIVDL